MISKVLSGALYGIDAYIVDVEVDLAMGLPFFSIVGLPDTAVKESRDRVKAAIKNSGYGFPNRKITVNLAPADIKKEGASFDLPIAVGILTSSGLVKGDKLKDYLMLGELSLDGKIKPVKGALPVAISAKYGNIKGIIVPKANGLEAAVVNGIEVFPVEYLYEVIDLLNEKVIINPLKVDLNKIFEENGDYSIDFSDVKGQEHVKRALEVAVAGGHNIIMIGPPGSGKTMLSRRISTIMPKMTFEEAIETTKIYSIIGLVPSENSLVIRRPFRSPHHTISDVGLVGGGHIPKPGEISLAHNGVLFLDELPEFKKNVLEVLRQPMEDGKVTISRSSSSITYPASFMLISACNPCPCGYFGDTQHNCQCTTYQIHKYRSKLSGPLLDRIDIHIDVPSLKYRDFSEDYSGECSEKIKFRVNNARDIQKERLRGLKIHCNSQMGIRQIKKFCRLDLEGNRLMELAMEKLGLSARAYTRVLKVARTIADLEGKTDIASYHLSEAIQYRSLDREIRY